MSVLCIENFVFQTRHNSKSSCVGFAHFPMIYAYAVQVRVVYVRTLINLLNTAGAGAGAGATAAVIDIYSSCHLADTAQHPISHLDGANALAHDSHSQPNAHSIFIFNNQLSAAAEASSFVCPATACVWRCSWNSE